MKVEASGYPDWVKTDSDKDKYITDYFENEGIILDKNNISKNPGFRSLSKALLNYLYGKFGERGNKLKKLIATKREQVVNLVSNESVEVHSMFDMSDDAVMFTYKHIEEADMDARYVNVAIAAYTTSHARRVLYRYLDTLKDLVLYFDTDSVIYVERENSPKIKTGDLLGDMTNELEAYGPDAYIDTFVSGGPKNYAFKVKRENSNEENIVCKVKGIRLNYMNSKIVNFETIKELLFSQDDSKKIELKNTMILREKNNIIYSMVRTYNYRINATKRRLLNDGTFETLPFGHI